MPEAMQVVDAYGGLGGNAVSFAEMGKQVLVLEADPGRRALLGQNLSDRGLRSLVELGDGAVPDGLLAACEAWPEAAVFLDPPWGSTVVPDQRVTWDELFPESAAWWAVVVRQPEVMLKLPRAFDLRTLPGPAGAWIVRWHLGDPATGSGQVVKMMTAYRDARV